MRVVGAREGDLQNTIKVPGYTLLDASVRYLWRNTEFLVSGTNLADKTYVAVCTSPNHCKQRRCPKSDRNGAVPFLIDPEVQRFVDEVSAAWARYGDLSTKSPEEARRIAEEVRAPWRRGGPPVPATESKIAGAHVRCYDPGPNGRKPALIYLHGGGWTVFSVNTHDRVMREYASRAGVSVIGVDYALAPEAKYPVALDQIVGVANFFAARGFDLAIGGDSAGANLAIATCIRLRDEGQSKLMRAMILNYGVYERHASKGAPEGILTAAEMEHYWHNYLRDESDSADPRVCPLRGDLRALPRALLVVPEFDLLTDQSLKLGKQLEKAGVPVQVNFYHGATHSFLEAVSISALASRAFDESAKWLRAAL